MPDPTPRKKRGFFKKLMLVVLGLFLLAAVAGAVVPFFINWNSVKDQVCASLSKQLKHKVTIESASFNLFTGISLNKVRVENGAGFAAEPLFSNDQAVVKYS